MFSLLHFIQIRFISSIMKVIFWGEKYNVLRHSWSVRYETITLQFEMIKKKNIYIYIISAMTISLIIFHFIIRNKPIFIKNIGWIQISRNHSFSRKYFHCVFLILLQIISCSKIIVCSPRNLFILLIPRQNYSSLLTFLTYTYLDIHIICKGSGHFTN